MSIQQIYNLGLEKLKQVGIEDYAFECDCISEKFLNADKMKRILHSDEQVDCKSKELFLNAIERRADGEPLQYILGEWEFMGLDFYVGKGVLIPRPETEMLVEAASEFLKGRSTAVVYDLCAGSGAIGLSVAVFNPNAKVFLFEKYDEAFEYLKKNIERLKLDNAVAVKCDILDGEISNLPKADIILSNPPYIKRDEIPNLQNEVLFEPKTALDGGNDGLDFYRAINDLWIDCVNQGGFVALECGDGQSEDIKCIFSAKSDNISVEYDFNNIDRVVKIKV